MIKKLKSKILKVLTEEKAQIAKNPENLIFYITLLEQLNKQPSEIYPIYAFEFSHVGSDNGKLRNIHKWIHISVKLKD